MKSGMLVGFGILIVCLSVSGISAQTTVVIGSFENKSDAFYLDSWERSIPEIMRSYFSGREDVSVLERDKVGRVLQEKALGMSGLTSAGEDTLNPLSAADFILSGTIDKQDGKIVITADLVRVKTGQVITERVTAYKRSVKEQMVAMLVNNILFRINNRGKYQATRIIASNAFWYWSASSALLGIGALVSHFIYLDNYKKYHQNEQLEKFDGYYNKANTANKISVTLVAVSVAAAGGALAAWINQKKTQTISAGHTSPVTFVPEIKLNYEKNIIFGIVVHF